MLNTYLIQRKEVFMKKGFTLAEVLITLGIIGVVAALSVPSLVSNFADAQIGPKLAKVKSTFELANQNLMHEEEAGTLISAVGITSSTTNRHIAYANKLQDYMKFKQISVSNNYTDYNGNKVSVTTATATMVMGVTNIVLGNGFLSPEGMIYFWDISNRPMTIESSNALTAPKEDEEEEKEEEDWRTGSYVTVSDKPHNQIAGGVVVDINGTAKPNRFGKDTFAFKIYNDGSLVPFGASGAEESIHWKNGKTYTCTEAGVKGEIGAGLNCTASILENNLKVIYQ